MAMILAAFMSSGDMLLRRLFSDEQEELANGLKELGFKIVNKSKGFLYAVFSVISCCVQVKDCYSKQ
ncbi:hypothetical protein MA16_Dca010074 [Dendrobium catenatum]|uniref:Uncharacterized protein n=1 Tax=Dendrobium catenatum TaxID=906689 RepID=A0A2I0X725_9ASPA|nr:hypothetical protein MA16_Dca010074 [Dendrobium catenatum]